MTDSHPSHLIATYGDLNRSEREDVDAHLAACETCQSDLALYRRQDQVLMSLPRVPMPLRIAIAVENATRRKRPLHLRLPRLPLATIGALVVLLVSLIVPIRQPAQPVAASGIPALIHLARGHASLPPYSGTARVSYQTLGGWDLEIPAKTATYLDHQSLTIVWSYRDPSHFRIDITTHQPALEQGTVTYVQNGKRLLVYDHRSDAAAVGSQPSSWAWFSALSFGLSFGAPTIGPNQTIAQFVQTLRRGQAPLHPPEYAKLTGRGTVAGRPATQVEFGPLQRSDYITGCSFTDPGHCQHHPSGVGTGRVWIDSRYPVVLKYRESGMTRDRGSATNLSYAVTSIHYGSGPTATDLDYRPPVPVPHVRSLQPSGSMVGYDYSPSPFLLTPQIYSRNDLSSSLGDSYQDAPGTKLDRIDITFFGGKFESVPGVNTHTAVGPYVFVQQRLQVHGLPAALSRGHPVLVKTCRTYSGTYSDGQRWVAFQKGPVSVLISTDTLTQPQLHRYASRMCGEAP